MRHQKAFAWLAAAILVALVVMPVSARGLAGSFYTTTAGCTAGNVTQFARAEDVYLGTSHNSGKGGSLPDGSYFVRVTSPTGEVLGTSLTATAVVSKGVFVQCYQLIKLVKKASNNSQEGFDLTTVPGGVFKVWLSPTSDFAVSKTHNFTLESAKATIQPQLRNRAADADDDNDELDDDRGDHGRRAWGSAQELIEQWRQWLLNRRFGQLI